MTRGALAPGLAQDHAAAERAQRPESGRPKHYYKKYAVDWGQDLRFYVNVLAFVTRKPVPDATDGWKSLHFDANDTIWIPSHDFAITLRGKVNSGSISYDVADALGIAEFLDRIGELIHDFETAISPAATYMPEAIARHVKQSLIGALIGLAEMLAGAMLLTALLAAGGALIGGPAGAAIGAKLAPPSPRAGETSAALGEDGGGVDALSACAHSAFDLRGPGGLGVSVLGLGLEAAEQLLGRG